MNYRIGFCLKILIRIVFKNKDVLVCCIGYMEIVDGRCV